MTTREDYEHAAQAAGYEITMPVELSEKNIYLKDGICPATGEQFVRIWRPLDDDGDSRRLEVACLMDIEFQTCEYGRVVHANEQGCGYMKPVDLGDNPCAATRLAVFRCAVEIGRRMQP